MTRLATRLGALCLAACAALAVPAAHAGLFDDEEARRAILDLRQRVDAARAAGDATALKLTEELRRSNEENAQLRRSLLELQTQIDNVRSDLAKQRGVEEQLARDVAEVQKRQKDIAQGVDERLR
jgi:TolA-binding protein